MNEMQEETGKRSAGDLVEVWFQIEKDADGYPESRSWEGMRAHPSNEGGFVLDSVPFYLRNVSRGDTVLAVQGEFLEFAEVLARGGHNTYRLLLADVPESEITSTIAELESLGLAVEKSENGILLAVDVPPSVDQREIDGYLAEQRELGRWQVQDGFLSSIEAA